MISPEQYIKALKYLYQQNVLWSETYLQTVSLNFQLVSPAYNEVAFRYPS